MGRVASPSAASTAVVPYQGRLTDAAGIAVTGRYDLTFRLYGVATGGSALWTESWSAGNAISVTAGLFTVLLGSLSPIPQSVITANSSLFLGVTLGSDAEMTPRVQLGAVPFAIQALTVPDASITSRKVAPLIKSVQSFNGALQTATGDAWTDLSGATITFTAEELPVNSTLLVFFMGQFRNANGVSLQTTFFLDSQETFGKMVGAGLDWQPMTLPLAFEVTPGAHTIKVAFKPLGGTAEATNYALTGLAFAR